MTAGYPAAANRLIAESARVSAGALEAAIAADPTFTTRYDEIGLRRLLRDAGVFVQRLALSVSSGDPGFTREFADHVAVIYRRRRVPMDDVIALLEGLSSASESILSEEERAPLDLAVDQATKVLLWYRRLSGDARQQNRLVQAIYKGA